MSNAVPTYRFACGKLGSRQPDGIERKADRPEAASPLELPASRDIALAVDMIVAPLYWRLAATGDHA